MSKHTELGDIAIQVGAYESQGKQKKRFRRIGVLMRTEYDDGGKNLWIKIHADALNPSLLIISRAYMEKGADMALLSVFPPKEEKPPANPDNPGADTSLEKDDVPF